VGDTVYSSASKFPWEDGENFGGISWPQDSAVGPTNTVDTFIQFFDKDMVQKIATEPNS
jgi:hypothetical protein